MKKFPGQYAIVAALIVLIGGAMLLAARYNLLPNVPWGKNTLKPVQVDVVPLGTIDKHVRITRTGSVERSTAVPVNAVFSGSLTELYVKEGQAVKAGQALFKLEPSAQQPVQEVVKQTSGAAPQSQANYDNALKEFTRYQKLYEVGAIARKQFENAAARLEQAKAGLDNTSSAEQASSSVPTGPATVTAPIDGIVTGLTTTPGKAVQAGQQLLSLGSGQELEAVVQLSQNDLYLVHLGTTAVIQVGQRIISGQVSRIYPQVAADQIPTFLAHIRLSENPSGLLQSGMSVAIHVETGSSAPVPAVPTNALLRDGQGRTFIYLAADNKASLQQITIGETVGDYTEITSNLPEQSLVLAGDVKNIKDGDAITMME